jgi:hypothetical protein
MAETPVLPLSGDVIVYDSIPVATVFDTSVQFNTYIVDAVRGDKHHDIPLDQLTAMPGLPDTLRLWSLRVPLHHITPSHRGEEVKNAGL